MSHKVYTKLPGMRLANQYLPDVAVANGRISIVKTPQDWQNVQQMYGDFMYQRIDVPKGQNWTHLPETNGSKLAVPGLITQIAASDTDACLLLWQPNPKLGEHAQDLRYQQNGGFTIGFALDGEQCVRVEIVGKGFDGNDRTAGTALHESYLVPLDVLPSLKRWSDLTRHHLYPQWRLTPEEYQGQRARRVDFLVEQCHFDRATVEAEIPTEYTPPSDDLKDQLLRDVILCLYSQQASLQTHGITHCWIQGNFTGDYVQVWEMIQNQDYREPMRSQRR